MDKLVSGLKRLSIVFRFQPVSSTPDSVLLEYLKSSEASKELVLKALRMCWLPYAYQKSGFKKGQQLKEITQEMIWALEGHIEELRVAFGVERKVSVFTQESVVPIAHNNSSEVEFSPEESELDSRVGVMGALASAAAFQFNTSGL